MAFQRVLDVGHLSGLLHTDDHFKSLSFIKTLVRVIRLDRVSFMGGWDKEQADGDAGGFKIAIPRIRAQLGDKIPIEMSLSSKTCSSS